MEARQRYWTKGSTQKDFITKSLCVIDSNHAQLHESKGFTLISKNPALAAGAFANLRIDIPADVYVHFQVARLASGGYAALSLYELLNLGTGGSIVTPNNHNRAYSVPSVVTVTKNITANLTGALELDHIHAGSEGGCRWI
jgi:hypothetical protein